MLMWHPKYMPLTEVYPSDVRDKLIPLGTYKSHDGSWFIRSLIPTTKRRRWCHIPRHQLPKQLRLSLLLMGIKP